MSSLADFDPSKYYLGRLCSRGHDYKNTGKSVRRKSGNCVECDKVSNKRYYEDNKEEILLHQKEYAEKNKERIKKYNTDYYQRNYDRVKLNASNWRKNNLGKKYLANREWAERNPEKVHESRRNWRHSNRGIQKEKDKRRRERLQLQADNSLTKEALSELYSSAKKCPYCGVVMSDRSHSNLKTAKSLDHLVPLSKGGTHSLFNAVICCLSCNSKKGDLSYPEWIERLDDPHRTNAENLYFKKYGMTPSQGVLPLVFE